MNKKIIVLDGLFDLTTTDYFINQLSDVLPNSTIFTRFDSVGGMLDPVNEISQVMFNLHKEKHCKFIAQIIHAESAALLLALNMHERHVIPSSVVQIHLPVPRPGELVLENEILIRRNSTIDFLMRRTTLTRENIEKYENIPLGANEMIHYNIATRKVAKF